MEIIILLILKLVDKQERHKKAKEKNEAQEKNNIWWVPVSLSIICWHNWQKQRNRRGLVGNTESYFKEIEVATEGIKDSDKLKLAYGGKVLGLSSFFTAAPAASINEASLKICQK